MYNARDDDELASAELHIIVSESGVFVCVGKTTSCVIPAVGSGRIGLAAQTWQTGISRGRHYGECSQAVACLEQGLLKRKRSFFINLLSYSMRLDTATASILFSQ